MDPVEQKPPSPERNAEVPLPDDRSATGGGVLRKSAVRAKSFWAAASVIIALIGAITGIVTVWQAVTKDSTNFSHLSLEVKPSDSALQEWAVDPALLGGFPGGEPCGSAQREWLETHGVELDLYYMVTMRNSAKEGPMLALESFRAAPDIRLEEGEPRVRVVCDPAGEPPVRMTFARLDLDDPGSVAHFIQVRQESTTGGSAPLPAAFNLAPGESGTLPLVFFTSKKATGSVELTVVSRGEERSQVIEGFEFSLPPLVNGGNTFFTTGGGGLFCSEISGELLRDCDVEAVIEEALGGTR